MFEMPYFGVIDTQNLSEFYETDIRIDEQLLELDLNFESLSAGLHELNQIKSFLELLSDNTKLAQKYLDNLDKDDELVVDYFECHQDLADDYELRLEVSTLVLKRIGIYPSDKWYAIFDFTFPDDLSDRFLTVLLNQDGSLLDVTHES
jgi:rRNA-processing protein FCF1